MGEPSLDASSPKRPDAPVLSSFVFLDTTGKILPHDFFGVSYLVDGLRMLP